MKKRGVLLLTLACMLELCACNRNPAAVTAEREAVSADYGKVLELARAEFSEQFEEFEAVQIEETKTMARTDDGKEVVVQFDYSSSNGGGVYGFLYTLDDAANPELVRHGSDITIDALLD